MINPKTQHFMANRMKATIDAQKVDHTPILTAPKAATEFILTAVKAALI